MHLQRFTETHEESRTESLCGLFQSRTSVSLWDANTVLALAIFFRPASAFMSNQCRDLSTQRRWCRLRQHPRNACLTLVLWAVTLHYPLPSFVSPSVPMRILVAEDDAPLADFLRQRLLQEQFAVQLASNGNDAQRLAADQSFDLVILDLNLPGTGGLEVLRGIRSRKPDLPVVVATASSMVDQPVQGLAAAPPAYFANPP